MPSPGGGGGARASPPGRGSGAREAMDIDMTPMMNMLIILISFLVTMVVFTQLAGDQVQPALLPRPGRAGRAADTALAGRTWTSPWWSRRAASRSSATGASWTPSPRGRGLRLPAAGRIHEAACTRNTHGPERGDADRHLHRLPGHRHGHGRMPRAAVPQHPPVRRGVPMRPRKQAAETSRRRKWPSRR